MSGDWSLTFQGHEALQIYLFNSAVLVVALWLSRVLDLSCSKRWSTGGVASSRTRPLTRLVGKFSKSKVGPKKKIRSYNPTFTGYQCTPIIIISFSFITMPNKGLTERQWRDRLQQFAAGTFKFGRGQRPPKNSERGRLVEKIEKCPKHRNASFLDPLNRMITCKCGYHVATSVSYTPNHSRCKLI